MDMDRPYFDGDDFIPIGLDRIEENASPGMIKYLKMLMMKMSCFLIILDLRQHHAALNKPASAGPSSEAFAVLSVL